MEWYESRRRLLNRYETARIIWRNEKNFGWINKRNFRILKLMIPFKNIYKNKLKHSDLIFYLLLIPIQYFNQISMLFILSLSPTKYYYYYKKFQFLLFIIIFFMLPKLQQTSLAQSLRRDNPASQIQGKSYINLA